MQSSPSRIPSTLCNVPVPLAAKPLKSIMLPPPCMTTGKVLLGLKASKNTSFIIADSAILSDKKCFSRRQLACLCWLQISIELECLNFWTGAYFLVNSLSVHPTEWLASLWVVTSEQFFMAGLNLDSCVVSEHFNWFPRQLCLFPYLGKVVAHLNNFFFHIVA